MQLLCHLQSLAFLPPQTLHACTCRCLCAAISQFYPGKWPATRPVILVCVIVYLIISAVTAIFQWKIEGNAFLHTKRTKVDCCPAQAELQVATALNDAVPLCKGTAMHCQPLQSLLMVAFCLCLTSLACTALIINLFSQCQSSDAGLATPQGVSQAPTLL